MPNLGKYEVTVLSAYGAGIVLIVLLIAWTAWRGARVRRQLQAAEQRRTQNNG